ncbi:MAG: protein kinase [Gemmatimonadota bacterium]|nr:protein kinase [Gemmatimonadota bacterium]
MHDIAQLNATLAGRYQLERQVGAGGMATVYLAHDLKHNRKVAVKVLNPDLAAVIGSERFLTEIQVTASLHHPHLLPLFDSGEADGALYYVMPYIEGETLRQRLSRERQLGVSDALRFATAIGGALDYAHRHGVIHRDLKPENVLIHDGQPLVMDFGIALAVSNAGGPRITQSGLSLGTPHYMSPEQASGGGQIDPRSDLYSLGAMLYEMLVGDPPHTGSTIQAVIARVLADKPASVRASRDSVPEHVDAAVMRALAKLPADRFATAAEFTDALAEAAPLAPVPTEMVPALRRRRSLRGVALWGGGLVVAGVLGAVTTTALRSAPAPHAAQFAVALPDTTTIPSSGRALAVSRDGAWIVMAAENRTGTVMLHIRPSTEVQFKSLAGTEGATSPAFSPDGSHIVFTVGGRIQKVPTAGGGVLTVADSGSAQTSWGGRDQVVFARGGDLSIVPAAGGTPRVFARPDSAAGHVAFGWPEVLPSGDHALITLWKGRVSNDSAYLAVISTNDGTVRELGVRGTGARYASGNVIYTDAAGKLWSAPYAAGDATLGGTPVLVAENVSVDPAGAADVSASGGGLLLYAEVASMHVRRTNAAGGGTGAVRESSVLVTTDSSGAVQSVSSQREPFFQPRVSPDGKRIAVMVGGLADTDGDVSVYDLTSGALTRLTQNAQMTRPEWDASGRRIAYRPRLFMMGSFVSQPADRSGTPAPIGGTEQTVAFSWGTAGRYLAIERRLDTNEDVWIVSRSGSRAEFPVDTTAAYESLPRLSPDERWVAYLSNEGGKDQVYVRPVPGPGARVPISITGGESPTWARDGKTLYYVEGQHLMAARIAASPEFEVTRRDTLIDLSTTGSKYLLDRGLRTLNYDVLPGGGFAFLATSGPVSSNRQNVIAMVDWTRRVRGTAP